MKKDLVFFADNGLTSTSANYLANLAKEMVAAMEEKLNSFSFFTHNVFVDNSDKEIRISTGCSEEDCKDIPKSLQQIIEMKQFISWIREALKAKERLANEVRTCKDDEVLKELSITDPVEPEYPQPITEDEYIASLSVKERNRIYSLQAESATLGQAVHAKGFLATARKEISEKLNGRDTQASEVSTTIGHVQLNQYTLSCPREVVEETFFGIQNLYREAQARLNAAMHEVSEAVAEENDKRLNEKRQLFAKYSSERQSVDMAIDNWRQKELRRIGKLRIVVPNDLMDTYKKLSSAGK